MTKKNDLKYLDGWTVPGVDLSPTPKVLVKELRSGAVLPVYGTPEAAGADLSACLMGGMVCEPGKRILVPTGLAMEIPVGWEGQVRPRSGIAAKHGMTVLNAPGTIDSDYRGEIMVMLINHGETSFHVRHGDRIAQILFARAPRLPLQWAEQALSGTERGEGGFGSTGGVSQQ